MGWTMLDGPACDLRCLSILDNIEDANGTFTGAEPKGPFKAEVQGTLARFFLTPGLAEFVALHPEIELRFSERDRWVDLVEQAVDCAIRWGALPESDLIVRPLGRSNGSPVLCPHIWRLVELSTLKTHRLVG